METKKYDFIDSLRGLAIVMVVFCHCGQHGSVRAFIPGLIGQSFIYGRHGVQLFFVVSAYTLMLSYNQRKTDLHFTRNFFIRRYFRLAPMYYMGILYFAYARLIGFQYFSTGEVKIAVPASYIISNVTFVHGVNPFWIGGLVPGGWSIAVEVMFYMTLPLIYKYIRNLDSAVSLFVISLVTSTLLKMILVHVPYFAVDDYLYYYFPNQIIVFTLGVIAFFIHKDGFGHLNPRSIVLIIGALFFYCYVKQPEHLIFALLFFCLLILLSNKPYKIIVNPVAMFIGKVSYSLYFVHFAFLYFFDEVGYGDFIRVIDFKTAALNYVIRFSLVLVCSIAVSALTYRLIEMPGINLGRKVIKRLERRT